MSLSAYTAAVVLLFALAIDSRCQLMAQTPNDASKLSAIMERLDLTVPLDLAAPSCLRKSLEELAREPCDQTAIADLGQWLAKKRLSPGCCQCAYPKEDVFAVARHNNVVTLPATVNDVSGIFVLGYRRNVRRVDDGLLSENPY
jgi:hypothetical protein